ncbi:MAG: hypothetical protein IAG13_37595 [Deltaproteobacteria bacterium]|nr:hypothetical protein [Nannocystaceae bacterium]
MDLLTILWGASVLGAGSFFACGLATHATLMRRRGRATDPLATAPPEPHARPDAQQLAALEASLARAAFDARTHGERASALEVSLARMGQEAQANGQRASTLESSLAQAKLEMDKQRARATTLEAALARANETVAAQRQRTATVESSHQERRGEQDAQREQALKVEAELQRTLQTAKRVELELAEVRRTLAAAEQRSEESTHRAGALALQLEEALAERTRVRKGMAPHAVPARAPDTDTVEANLAASLGTLADECGYEVVVLSDAQGLLLAGVGDEQVQGTVAALSSVARELTTRAAEFVALHPVLLEVTDVDGRTLRIRLFEWEQESIALASFGAGRIEPTRQEETVITVFPTLMAAS